MEVDSQWKVGLWSGWLIELNPKFGLRQAKEKGICVGKLKSEKFVDTNAILMELYIF